MILYHYTEDDPNPDGLLPHELGYAILASGNVAVVQVNGEVSDIVTKSAFFYGDYYRV